MEIVWFLLIGLVVGWLAGLIMKGRGYGFIVNIVIGCAGALLGGWIFGKLGIESTSIIGGLITALLGAIILLFIVNLIFGRRK